MHLTDPFAEPGFRLARRGVLVGLPAAALAGSPLLRRFAWAQQGLASEKLIVHRAAPLVAEPPLARLTSAITPNDLFHILTIMADPLPDIAPADWRLSVEGQVESPLTLSYDSSGPSPPRPSPRCWSARVTRATR